jgi:hypothetical protein
MGYPDGKLQGGTDATARVHRGAQQRGGVATRAAGVAEGDASERRTIIEMRCGPAMDKAMGRRAFPARYGILLGCGVCVIVALAGFSVWRDYRAKQLILEPHQHRLEQIAVAMEFDSSKRALDVFKNLEGNFPPGFYKSFALKSDVPGATEVPLENPPLENRPLYEFFTYSGEIENSHDTFVFSIPAGITSKADLMNKYVEMMPDYFGKNWDALDECLHDFYWIDKTNIIIKHEDVPSLGEKDTKVYLQILAEAVQLLRAGPRRDFILPDGIHKLEVAFPTTVRLFIQEKLSS